MVRTVPVGICFNETIYIFTHKKKKKKKEDNKNRYYSLIKITTAVWATAPPSTPTLTCHCLEVGLQPQPKDGPVLLLRA